MTGISLWPRGQLGQTADLPTPLPPELKSPGNLRSLYEKSTVIDWLSSLGTTNVKNLPPGSPARFHQERAYSDAARRADRDAEVPITQSYEYWNALRRLGIKTEFVVYPDEGHQFFKRSDQTDVTERIVGWFDNYLKPRR